MAKKAASSKKSAYSGRKAKDDPPPSPLTTTPYEIVYIDDSDIAPGKTDATLYLEIDKPLEASLPNTSIVTIYEGATPDDVKGEVQNAISNQITLNIDIPAGNSGTRTVTIEGGGSKITTKSGVYFTL